MGLVLPSVLVFAIFLLCTPSLGGIVALVEFYSLQSTCNNLGALQDSSIWSADSCIPWTTNYHALLNNCGSSQEVNFYSITGSNFVCTDPNLKSGPCVVEASTRFLACCIEQSSIVPGQQNCVYSYNVTTTKSPTSTFTLKPTSVYATTKSPTGTFSLKPTSRAPSLEPPFTMTPASGASNSFGEGLSLLGFLCGLFLYILHV